MKIRHTQNENLGKTFEVFTSIERDIYIVGRNKYGLSTARLLENNNKCFMGFLDDYCPTLHYEGYRVYKSSEIKESSVIINCVVEGRTWDVQNWIESKKPTETLDYFALQQIFFAQLAPIDFLKEGDKNLIENSLEDLNTIYHILADDQSKFEFENIINFRYNRDKAFMRGFPVRLDEQYFEPFLNLEEAPVFIDGGGFDGQTSLEFIKRYGNYHAIHFFEPSSNAFESSKKNLYGFNRINYYNAGLWNRKGILRFNPLLDSASKIDENGPSQIDTTTIDGTINGYASFIKLDIEGAEKEAIEGAQHTIKKYKPNLAVCVYHNQADFTLIPELILRYRPDYKVYFRHYTQGVFESVMYFV
jgi:FkbM family methyltransferase